MSYTTASATATCKIEGLNSTEDLNELASSIYDYLVNHHDEIPEGLDDDDMDSDDAVFAISSYLEIKDSTLVIAYDCENDGNCSNDVFHFLTSHLSMLQSSHYMTVNWSVYDSRGGSSGGTQYIDRKGDIIDIDAMLTAHFERSSFEAE